MEMQLSEILNLVLGGSLVASVISIVTIRSALKKARGEAEKALAEADTVKITNTENATRILMENIVEPLKKELNETRKDLNAVKRALSRLVKAVNSANNCDYRDGCPVLERVRQSAKDDEGNAPDSCESVTTDGTKCSERGGQRKRGGRKTHNASDGTEIGGESDDSDG